MKEYKGVGAVELYQRAEKSGMELPPLNELEYIQYEDCEWLYGQHIKVTGQWNCDWLSVINLLSHNTVILSDYQQGHYMRIYQNGAIKGDIL